MEVYSVVSLVSLSVTLTDNDKGELALILFLVSVASPPEGQNIYIYFVRFNIYILIYIYNKTIFRGNLPGDETSAAQPRSRLE
jgi:hypothetical protein